MKLLAGNRFVMVVLIPLLFLIFAASPILADEQDRSRERSEMRVISSQEDLDFVIDTFCDARNRQGRSWGLIGYRGAGNLRIEISRRDVLEAIRDNLITGNELEAIPPQCIIEIVQTFRILGVNDFQRGSDDPIFSPEVTSFLLQVALSDHPNFARAQPMALQLLRDWAEFYSGHDIANHREILQDVHNELAAYLIANQEYDVEPDEDTLAKWYFLGMTRHYVEQPSPDFLVLLDNLDETLSIHWLTVKLTSLPGEDFHAKMAEFADQNHPLHSHAMWAIVSIRLSHPHFRLRQVIDSDPNVRVMARSLLPGLTTPEIEVGIEHELKFAYLALSNSGGLGMTSPEDCLWIDRLIESFHQEIESLAQGVDPDIQLELEQYTDPVVAHLTLAKYFSGICTPERGASCETADEYHTYYLSMLRMEAFHSVEEFVDEIGVTHTKAYYFHVPIYDLDEFDFEIRVDSSSGSAVHVTFLDPETCQPLESPLPTGLIDAENQIHTISLTRESAPLIARLHPGDSDAAEFTIETRAVFSTTEMTSFSMKEGLQ